MTFVLPLQAVDPSDRELVGGKAAGCAALLRLGFDVPRGYAVTTDAFRAWLSPCGLDVAFAALLDAFRAGIPDEELMARCAALVERARRTPLAESLERAICDGARSLGPKLAVRSSATVEDARTSSFAGVFTSELGVTRDGLADAARAVWASAFSYGALTHALRSNLDPARGAMALLVQEMVAAERAGVLFTREPTGAAPGVMEIAWTRGTGEALMSGAEGGASVRIDRETGRLQGDGVGPGGDVLPAALLRRLVEAGRRIEAALGHPQDVEWASLPSPPAGSLSTPPAGSLTPLAHGHPSPPGGRLVLLQARPITTVEPLREPPITWTRELSEERFPRPISPLTWSILERLLPVNTRTLARRFGLVARNPRDVARTISHFVYSNEGFFAVPGSMRLNPLSQARFFAHYAREAADALAHLPGALAAPAPFGPAWLATSRVFRAFVFPHAREVEASWTRHLERLLAEMDAYDAVDPRPLRTRALWDHLQGMLAVAARYMEPDLAIYVIKMACSHVLTRLGDALAGGPDPDFLPALTSGVENRTLAMNAELEQVFAALAARPDLLALLRAGRHDELAERLVGAAASGKRASRGDEAARSPEEAFARFLARNGHNTTSWDMQQPTWGEDPAQVLALLAGYALAGAGRHGFGQHRAAQLERARRARERVRARLRPVPWLRPFFEDVLRTLHSFMAIDEEHHFYCSRLYRPMRRTFAELGARLVAGGVLAEPHDVYFLTHDELRAVLARAAPFPRRYLVAARRASFERARRGRPPERFRGQTPLAAKHAAGVDAAGVHAAAPAAPAAGALVLQGKGASPGLARGTVRVVVDPHDAAAFQAGEVLVTQSPNPVWTPLYAVASGLVTATGSVLSHGLVSAREYHLPAVIGIPAVTSRLATGQRVTVDGDRGTVSIEDD